MPWFKDPNIKLGIWAIIKDNIGKDMTKIAVPVFFNDPLNLLQKGCQSMEYTCILDEANKIKDQNKRFAWVAAWTTTFLTGVERGFGKPFNPLLGETYEYENDNIKFIAEQVSHHPPISA